MPLAESRPAASIRRILFPSDLSPEADRAFEHTRLLAKTFDAHVTLYHALAVPQRESANWAGHEDEVRQRREAAARAELHRRASTLEGAHDVVVEADVSAVPVLVDLAVLRQIERNPPDLVVMATHSRGALGAFFLGSVTEQVLRSSGRPVLVVPPCEVPIVGYRRILVPTDFSEASRRAFPWAALLARAFGAEVIAVHAMRGRGDTPQPLGDAVASTEAVGEFVTGMDGVQVTSRVERGAAWDRIVAVAAEVKADVIVMATQGADSLSERILGSQTDRVVRHAACPVLAV